MTHTARTPDEFTPRDARPSKLLNLGPEEGPEALSRLPSRASSRPSSRPPEAPVEEAPRAALVAAKGSKHARGRVSKKARKPRDRKLSSMYQCYKQARRETNEPALSYRFWIELRAPTPGALQWRYRRELRRLSSC